MSDEARTYALDLNRFDELRRHADLGRNLWHSLQLAAERGDAPSCKALWNQIRPLSVAASDLIKALGTERTDA